MYFVPLIQSFTMLRVNTSRSATHMSGAVDKRRRCTDERLVSESPMSGRTGVLLYALRKIAEQGAQ